MTQAIDKFNSWLASFSGCDGGNPEAKIWFCGIEWGMPKEYMDKFNGSPDKYYQEIMMPEINNGAHIPCDRYEIQKELYYPYGRSLAKLYAAIQGHPVEKYRHFIEETDGSEIFKMNLYPIPFPNESDALWDQYELAKYTGLQSKHIYRTWCFLHRFPFISKKVKERRPELIIGTGITYLTDFIVCFAGTEGIDIINKGTIKCQSESNKVERTYYWTNIDRATTLVVIPFFGGPNGLNSDYLLAEFGKEIQRIMELNKKDNGK